MPNQTKHVAYKAPPALSKQANGHAAMTINRGAFLIFFAAMALLAACSCSPRNNPASSPAKSNDLAAPKVRDKTAPECSAQHIPIIYLHGWAGSARSWDRIITDELDGYRHIAIDLAGFGDHQNSDQNFDYAGLVSDVEDQISHMACAQDFILVGHSLGGMIAQDILLRNQLSPSALVLTSAQPRFNQITLTEQSINLVNTIQDEPSQQASMTAILPRYFADPVKSTQLIEEALTEALRASPRALRMSFLTLPQTPPLTKSDFQRMGTPVLVITGEADIVPQETSRALADAFPNSSFMAIEQAGHMSHMEAPTAWRRAFAQFLLTTSPSRDADLPCKDNNRDTEQSNSQPGALRPE